MTDQMTQRERNVKVLELMGESYELFDRGERDRAEVLMEQAAQLDPQACSVIVGGMRIGEIPRPCTPEWFDYLDAARDHAAQDPVHHPDKVITDDPAVGGSDG